MKAFVLALILVVASAEKVIMCEGDVPTMTDTVTKGEQFTLSIRSNPTTGYRWELRSQPLHSQFQQPDTFGEFDIPAASTQGGAMGVGGRQLFKFLAQAAGQDRITLVYERPWTSEGAKTLEVIINIAG